MKTIWKSIVQPTTPQVQVWPEGAKPLYVDWQNRSMVIWFEVPDTDAPTEEVQLHVLGTGEEIPDGDLTYVGSVQVPGAAIPLVFHIYTEAQE